MDINSIGSNSLSELNKDSLGVPNPDNQIRPTVLKIVSEFRNRVNNEAGPVGAGFIKARGGFAVVPGVEAENRENGNGFVVGGVEALIVVDTQVVAEPDYGGTAEGSGGGRVGGAAGEVREREAERRRREGGG